jgi:anti-sigma B factor antagonist
MKFDVEKNGHDTVFRLHERKLDSTLSHEVKAEFLLLCKPKVCKRLIVDLTEVQFCDSTGLSALLIADRAMREHGGSVHLVHVHKKVMDLIKISMLDRVFTINKSVEEVLNA